MRDYVGERADWIADPVRAAQAGGELDPVLSPNALAHFCLLLSMGSALIVKVRIDSERCQGHGRCYDLAPELFGDDEEGYGMVLGGGAVPPASEHQARLAVANCPERAIELLQDAT